MMDARDREPAGWLQHGRSAAAAAKPRRRLAEHLFGGPLAGAEEPNLQARLARLESRLQTLRADGERRTEAAHLLFAPIAEGYALLAGDGPPPAPGTVIGLDAEGEPRFLVAKVGRSPLPRDSRLCAYLERRPATPADAGGTA